MAIEASFTVSEKEFPLSEIFRNIPGATVELDRVVPTYDALIPYFWIYDTDLSDLDPDVADYPGVKELNIIDKIQDQALVRIEWDMEYVSVLSALVETDVTLLSAIGKQDKWTFELRSEDQQTISDFQSYCQEHGIPIRLTQLHALSPMQSGQPYDLTSAQQDALTLAYARGYFDSPRTASQANIADELGISRQALSSRMQRGLRRLVASTLIGAG